MRVHARHLVPQLHMSNTNTYEIRHRQNTACKAFHMYKTFWKADNISIKLKRTIFVAAVSSTLASAMAAFVLTHKQEAQFTSTYCAMIRKILQGKATIKIESETGA